MIEFGSQASHFAYVHITVEAHVPDLQCNLGPQQNPTVTPRSQIQQGKLPCRQVERPICPGCKVSQKVELELRDGARRGA